MLTGLEGLCGGVGTLVSPGLMTLPLAAPGLVSMLRLPEPEPVLDRMGCEALGTRAVTLFHSSALLLPGAAFTSRAGATAALITSRSCNMQRHGESVKMERGDKKEGSQR